MMAPAMSADIQRSAKTLASWVLAAILLLTLVYQASKQQIAASQQAALAARLDALLPDGYDNTPVHDVALLQDAALGSSEALPVYRARQDDQPLAAVLTVIAPQGYSGAIRLLVGVRYDGSIIGVRVSEHRETPGLGDDIDIARSDWINGFDGLSVDSLPASAWRVSKDGGRFDQFTGATITPRAVVAAVYLALNWYRDRRTDIFQAPIEKPPD